MTTRLIEYLRHRTTGAFGWSRAYEEQIGARGTAWLAGHYDGLLNDVLRLLGESRILALAVAAKAVDERLRQRIRDPTVAPGDPIVNCSCPCCGASLEVMHGDDEGEVGVVGTPAHCRVHGPRDLPGPCPFCAAEQRTKRMVIDEVIAVAVAAVEALPDFAGRTGDESMEGLLRADVVAALRALRG